MEMYKELGDQGHRDEGDWAIVLSGVPSNIIHVEREEDDRRAHIIPSNFADAEQEEDGAWRNHMAIGGQIEEGLSQVMDLFSQAYHNASNVSVLFAHSQYYKFVFRSCFFMRLPTCSNSCPCRGRRMKG